MTDVMQPGDGWRSLGDVLEGLHYMGRCSCGSQHMSRLDRVYVLGDRHLCASCGRAYLAGEGKIVHGA